MRLLLTVYYLKISCGSNTNTYTAPYISGQGIKIVTESPVIGFFIQFNRIDFQINITPSSPSLSKIAPKVYMQAKIDALNRTILYVKNLSAIKKRSAALQSLTNQRKDNNDDDDDDESDSTNIRHDDNDRNKPMIVRANNLFRNIIYHIVDKYTQSTDNQASVTIILKQIQMIYSTDVIKCIQTKLSPSNQTKQSTYEYNNSFTEAITSKFMTLYQTFLDRALPLTNYNMGDVTNLKTEFKNLLIEVNTRRSQLKQQQSMKNDDNNNNI